jgi:cytochrome b6-f complex iron-sulfur subunit
LPAHVAAWREKLTFYESIKFMMTPMNATSPVDTPRRSFLARIWKWLGILVLLEFTGLAIAYLWPRKPAAKKDLFGGIVTAGAVAAFAPYSVTAFQRGRFYLVRLADGGFLALSRTCTHLGCTVPWVADEKKFVCPCHASVFDMTGAVIGAPASRALDLFPVLIENDIVSVDTGKTIKRNQFKPSQVTRA